MNMFAIKVPGLLFTMMLFVVVTNAQDKNIPYGNNARAGKYYNVRGFNMYCEVYGTGKPLLMIHGNGGSIGAFANNIPYFAKKIQGDCC